MIDAVAGAQAVIRGGVIAYPTEACFGIGCDPADAAAVDRVIRLKQRPQQKGLIVIADRIEAILPFLAPDCEAMLEEPRRSWPGPYTWIFPVSRRARHFKCVADGKIAVRITAHRTARQICRLAGGAMVSTSANVHRQIPMRDYRQVERCLGSRLDFVVRGCLGAERRPTEIRDAASGLVLRSA